jgi:hypothetical protein
MAHPVYILCSRSGAVDGQTRLLSFFDVIEEFQLTRADRQGETLPTPSGWQFDFFVVAVWMRENESPEQGFQAQFVAHFPRPDQPEREEVFAELEFKFIRPFQRLIIRGKQVPNFEGPGTLRIECRIRPVGQEGWSGRQEFPIILREVTPPNPTGQPHPAGAEAPATD